MGVIGDYIAALTQAGIVSQPLTRTAASLAFALPCADGKLVAVHLSRPDKFWNGLLDAIERRAARDLHPPIEVERLRQTIREHFPDHEF